jgi:uracil-DNA glycosylase family 4
VSGLAGLAERVLACRRCPRLVAYHAEIRREHPGWHCAPVPGFGDPRARAVLIGLAPSKTGGNRTSRIFTGDKTAEFLFRALHAVGWSSASESLRADDSLRLDGLWLTPALKCAPPQDKPTPEELRACFPFLGEELTLLAPRVVIALGKIAHDSYLRFRGLKLSAYPFAHGAVHDLGALLVDTYHCSPRNTNTGTLTMASFVSVLRRARALALR